MARLFCVLGISIICACPGLAQVTVIDTGSTNITGMNVKLEKTGPAAMIEQQGGKQTKLILAKPMCSHLMADLKAAGPLNKLPVPHCMKSVSFGTSLFIEYKGARSPDLSCPQPDPRMAALKKDAMEIMNAAKAKVPVGPRHVYR